MDDAASFLSLAEIAGVFVGFGALISVRSSEGGDTHTRAFLRQVMWNGLWAAVTALAPVTLSGYGLEGRSLWVPCSVFALVLFALLYAFDASSPESRAESSTTPRKLIVVYGVFMVPIGLSAIVSLVLIVIDALPGRERALYVTAVTMGVFLCGVTLLLLVFTQHLGRRAKTPS